MGTRVQQTEKADTVQSLKEQPTVMYPLARDGVFLTIQGEGDMVGLPMIFIRLAGCSVGCPLCDTDYKVHQKWSTGTIVIDALERQKDTYTNWVWITGGEPFDHDIMPLVESLREAELNVAIATSGHMPIPDAFFYRLGCRIVVSPHDPTKWVQMTGHELNIVPGLNGFKLSDFMTKLNSTNHAFRSKRVTPCEGLLSTVKECRDFVAKNRGWSMGVQAHKQWQIP